jgi:hypothetical protein
MTPRNCWNLKPLINTKLLRERPFNLKGGLWFFSKKIFWFPMLLEKIFWFWWRKKKYSNSCVVRKKFTKWNKKPHPPPPLKLNDRSIKIVGSDQQKTPIGYAILADLMSGKAKIKHMCVSYFPSCPILKPQPKTTFGHVSVNNVKVENCLALTLCSM